MVTTEAAPSKIKFWSPSVKHLVHKTWDETDDEERKYLRLRYPGLAPAEPEADAGRYDSLREQFEALLHEARQMRAAARDVKQTYRAEARIDQLTRGLKVLDLAEEIPLGGPVRQFGDRGSRSATTFVPPAIDEFSFYEPIRFRNHRYLTENPIEIAFLRMAGFEEVPLGQTGWQAGTKDRAWVDWFPAETWASLAAKGVIDA
jgi:hypothetical protein